MTPTQNTSEIIDPRWDVLIAIAEVTRLALESGHVDIAKSWTVAQEQFCHPQIRHCVEIRP